MFERLVRKCASLRTKETCFYSLNCLYMAFQSFVCLINSGLQKALYYIYPLNSFSIPQTMFCVKVVFSWL